MRPIKKLTISAMMIALYIIVMFITRSFAFEQIQIRIATSLYALTYIFPFLIIPFGAANFLSNTLFGGLGPLDMFGGAIAGMLTSTLVYLIRRFRLNEWLIALPVIFVPGLLVPVWLSYLLDKPYSVLAVSLCVGQIIPGVFGVILVKQLKRIFSKTEI